MQVYKLKNFKLGWICGSFFPSLIKTENFELAIKYYKKNDYDKKHHHKKSIEYTIIAQGKVQMNDNIYTKGDIIIIGRNEATNFKALSNNVITVVLKIPSCINDKYIEE